MTKIVYNAEFGGFKLSLDTKQTYACLRNMCRDGAKWRVASEGTGVYAHHWLERRYYLDPGSGHPDYDASRGWGDPDWEYVSSGDLERADPILIEAVEQHLAENPDLRIRDLPPGTRYIIDEYDGAETVMTIDEFNWKIA